jgi:hypothetical protein
VEQAHETAIGARKYEEAEHVGVTDIVAAEFETRQREVHICPTLVDQIARLMPA